MASPNDYTVGALVRLKGTFTDASGVAADPGTVTLLVWTPGAASSTSRVYGTDPNVIKDGVGLYHYDQDVEAAGTWRYRWQGTGAVQAAGEASFKASTIM